MGERSGAYRALVGIFDNIRMDLRYVRWRGMDYVDLAEDRDRRRTFVNAVMKRRTP